jgi:Tol biopolymer transport system component
MRKELLSATLFFCMLLGTLWGAGCSSVARSPSAGAQTARPTPLSPSIPAAATAPSLAKTAAPYSPRPSSADTVPPTLISPLTSSPTLVAPLPGDGKGRIVYVSRFEDREEIFIMYSDGSNRTCLTCGQEVLWQYKGKFGPRWSPDGQRIAFFCQLQVEGMVSHPVLYMMNADGYGLVYLGSGYSFDWFPDGERIIFDSVTDTGTEVVERVQIAQADGTSLSSFPFWGISLNVSPDGTKLIYTKEEPFSSRYPYLYVLDLATGEEGLLVQGVDIEGPKWFPDSTKIVYEDYHRPHGTNIYVADIGTRKETQLTHTGRDGWPAVSPDGSRIAFVCSRGTAEYGLCLMYWDGSVQMPLPVDMTIPLTRLSWSPDGTKIVFSSKEKVEEEINIYVIAPDGTGFARLTDDGGWDADWGP